MESSSEPLAQPIVDTNAVILHLGDILESFDPDQYERADTTYRKPSYQRGLNKPLVWNQSLIESILDGKSIGAIVVSRWLRSQLLDDNTQEIDEFYNIEDGGTRLSTCKKFLDGKFTTKYGDITNPEIKRRFMRYKVPTTMIEKAHSRVRDSHYFEALCDNFSLLQEGTKLTSSDRYCAVARDAEHNFSGSPIINFTIQEVQRFDKYNALFGLSNVGPRESNRKKLTSAVSLISGMMFGPKFANEQYGKHLKILFKELTDALKHRFQFISKLLFSTIEKCLSEYPKWSGERFVPYFNKTKLFSGLMIADINKKYPVVIDDDGSITVTDIIANDEWNYFVQEFQKRWVTLINTYRKHVYEEGGKAGGDNWLETKVYTELGAGKKRNSLGEDLIKRMEAVQVWYESL